MSSNSLNMIKICRNMFHFNISAFVGFIIWNAFLNDVKEAGIFCSSPIMAESQGSASRTIRV